MPAASHASRFVIARVGERASTTEGKRTHGNAHTETHPPAPCPMRLPTDTSSGLSSHCSALARKETVLKSRSLSVTPAQVRV